MDFDFLYKNMLALFAYDTGCVSSGVKNECLRGEIEAYLKSLDEMIFRLVISKIIREAFLIDEALELGYGIEDVKSFLWWLDDKLGIYI